MTTNDVMNASWFASQVPAKPSGRYAHLIVLRVTDSYALFQTEGELNTARVQTSLSNNAPMTRIAMFKRKQTTAERLVGRELLRRYGFLSGLLSDNSAIKASEDGVTVDPEGKPVCDYNEAFCKTCPDCISYGFAIGDSGSEKSKIITDTAYSLTAYDHSHETMTLNAPYEEGTMSRKGEVTSRINEQDHVKPQVIFPAVITIRDVTWPLFQYVLSNVARTKRYGAQTTRTGSMTNHIVGLALTDGEIFSNLRFTQSLFDAVKAGGWSGTDLVAADTATQAAVGVVEKLIQQDRVAVDQLLTGAATGEVLAGLPTSDEGVSAMLRAAFADSRVYFDAYISKSRGGKDKKAAKRK